MKHYITKILFIAIAALSLSGCATDEPYYNSPIIGRWALYEINGYAPGPADDIDYEFYEDGRGAIVYNASQLNSYSVVFNWDATRYSSGAEYLTLYVANGEVLNYLVRIEYSPSLSSVYSYYMYLTDLDTGDRLVFVLY